MKKITKFEICVAIFLVIACSIIVLPFGVIYPLKYKKDIISIASKYNFQPALIASIIHAESRFNKKATSNAGAVGLMQLMPSTIYYICDLDKERFNYNDINAFDEKINIELGVYYLNYLREKFNDNFTMLCAYNAGEGNVVRWLKMQEYSTQSRLVTTPYKETNTYATKILKNIKYYQFRL